MEYKTSKGLGTKILIVVLSVCVLAMGSFIVYDKVIVNNTKSNNNFNAAKNDDNSNGDKNISNSYQIFSENLIKGQLSEFDSYNHSYQYVSNDSFGAPHYEVYINEKGSLFINNDKYKNYKIADNVLSFYVIPFGQDLGNMLFFINADGTVGSADIEYPLVKGEEIYVVKDIGYNNIVSMIPGSYGINGPIFIDIDGNMQYYLEPEKSTR